jgi:hypothetical protein
MIDIADDGKYYSEDSRGGQFIELAKNLVVPGGHQFQQIGR